MKYINIQLEHEFSSILCGRLSACDFVHMERMLAVHVLIIVEKGTLNITIGDTDYKVKKGEAVILPSKIRHCGFRDEDSAKSLKYFWAHFFIRNEFFVSDTRSGDFCIPIHFKLTDFPRVSILYNQLLDVHRLTSSREKYCDFLLTALFCELETQSAYSDSHGSKVVSRAVSWIEYNIEKNISLDDVSEALGYNKRYLSRVFKECMSRSVNDFIIDKKLTLAKQMLSGSDERVSSIAEYLGFNDAGYFMRVFKKHEGITALEYRNAYSRVYMNKV